MTFETWLADNSVEIEQVQKLLVQKLSDNPTELVDELKTIDAWYGRMTTLLAEANSYLAIAEDACLVAPGHKDWTDLDRRTDQKARVASQRRIRDVLDGLCEAIKSRLILGMSITKQNTSERTVHA